MSKGEGALPHCQFMIFLFEEQWVIQVLLLRDFLTENEILGSFVPALKRGIEMQVVAKKEYIRPF